MSNGIERREFLKVLGVAGAGAGLAGCREPERLIPYVVGDEDIVPGMATWYRTTCRECPAGCGMNVRTREGRAVKVEGNPLSPISHGKLCARGQASLHGLYNPDRVPQPLARGAGDGWDRLGWDEAEQRLAEAVAQARGRAVFLTHDFTGTMDRLLDEWSAALGVRRVRWDTFGHEALRTANRLLFGIDAVPSHDFGNADVVITFGADFMETWLSPVDYAHGFGKAHAYNQGRRGRLISVTPHQSLTDMNADEWLACRPGTEHLVALALARAVVERGGGDAGAAAPLLQNVDIEVAAEQAGVSADRLHAAAREFARGGRSLAVGPGVATSHAAATSLAAAVALLNQVAGNIGTTVRFDRQEHGARAGSFRELRDLTAALRAGQVQALLVHGPNPLYTLPSDGGEGDLLERVPFVASFSPFLDETSRQAHLLLPDHHFLESWGDYSPRTGVHGLVQPVMMPVYQTKQTGDVLLSVARRAGAALPRQATTFYDYLRGYWAAEVHPAAGATAGFEEWWPAALQQGTIVADSPATAPVAASAGLGQLPFDVPAFTGPEDGYYLIVYPSLRFYDGRLANRPWLQELPDPISKISWASWVEVHPSVARELGLSVGSVVRVRTPHGEAELPAWIHPGIRPDTIAVQLGQGHEEFSRYARGRGVNAMRLLGPAVEPVSGGFIWQQARATLEPTGRWEHVPYTAGSPHQADRHVAQEIALGEARELDLFVVGAVEAHAETGGAAARHADAAAHAPQPGGHHGEAVHPRDQVVRSLQDMAGFKPIDVPAGPAEYPPPGTYYGAYSEAQPRWAMSIDLDRCIGCSACMTACQAENNIAVVGPDLVRNGRLIPWIRIERYFEEEHGEHRATRFLPMLCQHCGNAPCEPVCPVYAAYHTPDGLNAQVYNRCVGTRYCANNCPYKVRYYNWYSYEWPEPLNWQLNPDVTVREKGVMEKCTFCVQRIRGAQHTARLEGRVVADGEIVPACAQTCPTDVIAFGNIKDPGSRVAHMAASGRAYRVLEELNTQSAITYLKRVVTETTEA
jgi:anaerobic selenocysteine-containing dehydrogenase/Fe-S-cluster-containing dehydrogenase component